MRDYMRNLAVGFRITLFTILLSLLLLPVSPGKSKGQEVLILGFLEHYNSSEARGHRVRIAFKKEDGLWKVYQHDFDTPEALDKSWKYFPQAISWNICFDGRNIGSLRSRNPNQITQYMDVGLQVIESNSKIPTIGEPSLSFSGFLYSPVYRPLLLNSQPHCNDPD